MIRAFYKHSFDTVQLQYAEEKMTARFEFEYKHKHYSPEFLLSAKSYGVKFVKQLEIWRFLAILQQLSQKIPQFIWLYISVSKV